MGARANEGRGLEETPAFLTFGGLTAAVLSSFYED
jgi:hypothetical protein